MSFESDSKRRKGNEIDGQFIAHLVEMRKSPAWRALSGSDLRVLFRIEQEHAEHGGRHNGRLKVTYLDFVAAGVKKKNTISSSIRRLEALGFIEVRRMGHRGSVNSRAPSQYRLTYLVGATDVTVGASISAPPVTNEWRKLATDEDVLVALSRAAAPPTRPTRVARGSGGPDVGLILPQK